MCIDTIIPESIPHRVKPRRVTASEPRPNALIRNLIPRHITPRSLSASDLWPNSLDSKIRECPRTLQNDKSLPRFVKRPRTASDSQCSNWTQVDPEFDMGYRVQVHQETRWSMNAERLPGRTNNERTNQWHNYSENRLKGKRKMCDLNMNLEDNFFSDFLEEDDSDETSGSDSDSEAYSGPS